MHTLNARSLHSTDHRFAMICSGRDDRVGGRSEHSRPRQSRAVLGQLTVKVKIPTLTSHNKSGVEIGPFLRRWDGPPGPRQHASREECLEALGRQVRCRDPSTPLRMTPWGDPWPFLSPRRAGSFPALSHGLRRGLHSCAASRLEANALCRLSATALGGRSAGGLGLCRSSAGSRSCWGRPRREGRPSGTRLRDISPRARCLARGDRRTKYSVL
jgi:hypothetical protein